MRIPSLHGWLILAMMILSAWSPVSGRFEVEKNSISVTSPSSIKGMYDSAIGNFGVPQYGGSMVGIVVYPKKNTKACQPFSEFDISFKPARTGGLPSIVLVDRGDCFFALKAWNAQLAGAAAVIVADDKQEPLITMDSPEDDKGAQQYAQNVTIPSALVDKSFGDKLKKALDDGEMVNINLDWRESLPHPDDKVEYELWTNSNDQCGPKCDTQREFLTGFRGAAQILEKQGYAVFTPHYITWYCPHAFRSGKQCQTQCINHGRYCAPDPDADFDHGYSGRDVVIENLRQLCVHKVATEMEQPWTWWDYVIDLQVRCGMKDKRYSNECAKEVLKSLRLPVDRVEKCMGDTEADDENPILKQEQVAQVGRGPRSDVTILPTLIINNRQYRGKLEKTGVLKAVCAGFQEGTEPEVCLNEGMETNECLINNGGCWRDTSLNVTACKDTFRGRVCECPTTLTGLIFRGDGYRHCEPVGPTRCNANNGGCWQETRDGVYRTACKPTRMPENGVDITDLEGCKCPAGFTGDGIHSCEDVDECKAKSACQCKGCRCKNTWGSYDCECEGDLLYVREHDICISRHPVARAGWATTFIVLSALMLAGVVAYMIYKYRIRSYMDSEIRAIMAQYMPLDNQNNVQVHIDEL